MIFSEESRIYISQVDDAGIPFSDFSNETKMAAYRIQVNFPRHS